MASSDLVKNGDATLSIRRFEVIFFDGPTGFSLGTPEGFEEGSAVTEVVRGGPADRAKIKVGDVLVAIGDEDTTHLDHETTHGIISSAKRPMVLHFETTRAKTAEEKSWSELKTIRNGYVSVSRMDVPSTLTENRNMIEERDYQHNLALCYACADGDSNAVKAALIDGQILAVDDNSENGYTILDDKGIVETKVNYQVDWQDKNSDGDAATHMAAYAGSEKILNLLFDKGWSPTLRNYSNISVYQTAKDYGYHDAIALWIKEYIVVHSRSFRGEFGNTSIGTSDNHEESASEPYTIYIKDSMPIQEYKELENRWLRNEKVIFHFPSTNRKVSTVMVDDEQATADINNISADDAKTNEELRAVVARLSEEKEQLENYITERLGRIQNQYKQSILSLKKQHEMELQALEQLDGEWRSMKESLWKGKKK